jgi:hypothetical protein
MNTVRMGVIALCAAVGLSGYLSLRGAETEEANPALATRAQKADVAASNHALGRSTEPALDMRTLDTAAGPAFEADASDLMPPSQTLGEVLEAFNADIGAEGEYVDREALADLLRSDPELAKQLKD